MTRAVTETSETASVQYHAVCNKCSQAMEFFLIRKKVIGEFGVKTMDYFGVKLNFFDDSSLRTAFLVACEY